MKRTPTAVPFEATARWGSRAHPNLRKSPYPEAKEHAAVHLLQLVVAGLELLIHGLELLVGRLQLLVANAITHHDHSEGHVHISARDGDGCWELAVADDGPGIAPAYRSRIFEMFQRLDPGKANGTGIGLALVKKVVEEAGGRVWVEPSLGRGATFRFTWPKVPEDAPRLSLAPAHQWSAKPQPPDPPARAVCTLLPLGTIVSEQSPAGPPFETITGYRAEEAVGRKMSLLNSGHHDREFYARMWGQLLGEGRWQGEIWNRRKNGEIYPEWLNVSAIRDAHGVVSSYVGVFSDIGTQSQVQERIHHLAYYDVLTGLPNRQLFNDRLEMSLARARHRGRRVAVLFLDLGRFKAIADGLGHSTGDRLLQEMARRFKVCLREGDSLSRLGGDEFTFILQDFAEAEQVATVAAKLIAAVAQPVLLGERRLRVSASVGIALYPDDGEDAESLLKAADTAMYRAKAAGRNGYRFFSPEMARPLAHLTLEHDLWEAGARGELRLEYQPQVALGDGRCIGQEALVRWQHPQQGLIGPGRAAEKNTLPGYGSEREGKSRVK